MPNLWVRNYLSEELVDLTQEQRAEKDKEQGRKPSQGPFPDWWDFQTNRWDCCLSLASNSAGTEQRVLEVGTGKGWWTADNMRWNELARESRLF